MPQTKCELRVGRREVALALGSNMHGPWGSPEQSLIFALQSLCQAGLKVKSVSGIYRTQPVGGMRQAQYLNAVVIVELSMGLGSLLRLLKRLERAAGRRSGRHWGPRPLDLDIIDAGVRLGRQARGRRPAGRLILPHPEMHLRAFVLVPLAEIAPHWRHAGLGRSIQQLLQARRVQNQKRGVHRVGPLRW